MRIGTIIIFLFFAACSVQAQGPTTDTKDVQVARQRLRVGLDTSKYWTSILTTISDAANHRQGTTAKAVRDWTQQYLKVVGSPITGQTIKWDGTKWVPADDLAGVNTDATISGNGAFATPIKISQQGATTGQVLKWNGSTWIPQLDNSLIPDTLIIVSDGQSNSIGQGIPLFPKTYTFSNRIKVWNGSAWVAPLLGSAPFNTNGANNSALQFAQKITDVNKNTTVLLIQSGNSGQPISYWLGGTGINATNTLVTNAIGSTKKVDIFVWTQGESDYTRTSDQYYSDYYTLRNEWLTKTWYGKNVKHINVGLYTGVGQTLGFQNETLKKIGSDTIVQTSYCNPYGLTTYDALHWDDISLTDLGSLIYNTYLSTPYAYKLPVTASLAVNSNNFITKSNGSAFVNSRLTDDNTNLRLFDSANKSTFLIESDKSVTGIGDETAEIRFSGRWGTAANANSDFFNDATISLYKSTTFNNGGSSLKFSTSALGGGGLTTQGYIDMDGHFDARTGFRIGGTAPNNGVLVGDGTSFKSLIPTSNTIQAWGGVRNDGMAVGDGVLFTSPTNSMGAVTSSRLTFLNNVNAGLIVSGGDGAGGSGAYLLFKKDGVNNFTFGSESSFFGGTGTGGMIFQYGNNPFFFATDGAKRMTIKGDGTIGVNTINPAATFHIEGTARITSSQGSATSVMGRNAAGDISNVTAGTIAGFGDISGTGATDYLTYFTSSKIVAGNPRFTVNNSALAALIINGGDGAGGSGSYLQLKKDGTNQFILGAESTLIGGTSFGSALFQYGNNPISFYTDGTKKMMLDGSGNLSINNQGGAGNELSQFTAGGVLQRSSLDPANVVTTSYAFGGVLAGTPNFATIIPNAITNTEMADNAIGPNELINTAVTAGTYTNPTITIDADGRINAASNGSGGGGVTTVGANIAPPNDNGLTITGSTIQMHRADDISLGGIRLAGDLDGTYNAPVVDGLKGRNISNTAPVKGQAYRWNGGQWQPTFDNDYTTCISTFAEFMGTTIVDPIFTAAVSGTGAANTLLASTVAEERGNLQHATGSTATGRAQFITNTTISLGQGPLVMKALNVRFPVLSDATNRYQFAFGLHDGTTFANAADGVFIGYDEANSTFFRCYSVSNSVITTTTTGTTVAAATPYDFRIEINAAANSVGFFINNTLVATHTTDIPTGVARSTRAGSNLFKTVGTTSSTCTIDAIGYSESFTTTRE